MSAIKFEAARIHFLSQVFLAVAVVVAYINFLVSLSVCLQCCPPYNGSQRQPAYKGFDLQKSLYWRGTSDQSGVYISYSVSTLRSCLLDLDGCPLNKATLQQCPIHGVPVLKESSHTVEVRDVRLVLVSTRQQRFPPTDAPMPKKVLPLTGSLYFKNYDIDLMVKSSKAYMVDETEWQYEH